MFNWKVAAPSSVLVLVLAAACSSSPKGEQTDASAKNDDTSETAGLSAVDEAEALKAAIPSVTKLVTITEKNDPNDLIGRPNGYVAAVVLHDSRGDCGTDFETDKVDETATDCGAKIEQWPDEAGAKRRSKHIQGIQKEMGSIAGSEWNYVKGGLLLRVGGNVPPSANEEYKAAFLK